MTGKGRISTRPSRTLALMIAGHAAWVLLVCGLSTWWGILLYRQGRRIYELEGQLGFPPEVIADDWQSTQRMIFWESTTYLAFIALITGFLTWFYLRELRRSRGLQAFFASLTHELRTPLTSIRLQAEMLEESVGSQPAGQKLVRRLLEDTARLEGQVERTLELSRVESGGLLMTEQVELQAFLKGEIAKQVETYGEKVRVSLPTGDTPVWIEADRNALSVIVRNTIENAVRHSGRSSGLVVEFRVQRAEAGAVLLFVSDNGSGADSPRNLGKLFSKGSKSQGAGVGLYLIQALMERMRGQAKFSSLDQGFSVQLKFREAETRGA